MLSKSVTKAKKFIISINYRRNSETRLSSETEIWSWYLMIGESDRMNEILDKLVPFLRALVICSCLAKLNEKEDILTLR